MSLSVSLHRFFWIGKIYLKHRKWYEFCTNSQDRNHQEYQCTRKSRLHKNIKFLTKTNQFYTKTSKTPTLLKSHQTPRKYWNHTKHHENTEITPNTTKTLKSHQRLPNIVRLPQLIPKYLGRARPSQNSRASNIWVGHALQKEGPLQEKKNMPRP